MASQGAGSPGSVCAPSNRGVVMDLGTQGGFGMVLPLTNVTNSPDNVQLHPRSTARPQTQSPARCEDSGASGWVKAQEGNVENPSGGGRENISSVTLGETPLGPVLAPSGTREVPWEVDFGTSAGSGNCPCPEQLSGAFRALPAPFSLWHLWPPLRWVPAFCAQRGFVPALPMPQAQLPAPVPLPSCSSSPLEWDFQHCSAPAHQ